MESRAFPPLMCPSCFHCCSLSATSSTGHYWTAQTSSWNSSRSDDVTHLHRTHWRLSIYSEKSQFSARSINCRMIRPRTPLHDPAPTVRDVLMFANTLNSFSPRGFVPETVFSLWLAPCNFPTWAQMSLFLFQTIHLNSSITLTVRYITSFNFSKSI